MAYHHYLIGFLALSSLLGLPVLDGKHATAALPDTVPIKVSCVKGLLEDGQCILKRPSVLRCPNTYELHKTADINSATCVKFTKRPAVGFCSDEYSMCHSDYHCCREIPADIEQGCPGHSEKLSTGQCKDYVPVEAELSCQEGYDIVADRCQQSNDYDCSPLLPVLTRGPLKPRAKKPTEQTFVITQTCRDVRTVAGIPVCPAGSEMRDGILCVEEHILDPVDMCAAPEGTLENCFTLDVVDAQYSCAGPEEELVCVERKLKVAKKTPRVPALVCMCETKLIENAQATCVRGELENPNSLDSPCVVISDPVEKCPRAYERFGGLCHVKGKAATTVPPLPPTTTEQPSTTPVPSPTTLPSTTTVPFTTYEDPPTPTSEPEGTTGDGSEVPTDDDTSNLRRF